MGPHGPPGARFKDLGLNRTEPNRGLPAVRQKVKGSWDGL